MQHNILAIALFFLISASGVKSSAQEYAYPLKGVSGLQSASFGELRPNHFHSGIDIKTEGVEGKPIVAVASGYVSRISLSPSGYGTALYITHPLLGTTSVYGHLSRLRDDLRERIIEERYEGHRNRVDVTFRPEEFPIGRGECVAWSGNSGTSFGPHLHFEIRDNVSQSTLNTVAHGWFVPQDHIAPRILKLHYVEIDSVGVVAVAAPLRSYGLRKEGKGYVPTSRVEIGRCGYFVVEARDARDSVSNRFGVYCMSEWVNGNKHFEYRMDGFPIADSRYCNAVSYYPLQRSAKCEVIRLAQAEGCPEEFYPCMIERGVVHAEAGEVCHIRIEVADDCGNTSVLEFDATGKDERFVATGSVSPVVDRSKSCTVTGDNVAVTIPQGALYESVFSHIERLERKPHLDSTLVVLSPVYRIMDSNIPIHSMVKVAISADIPISLQRRACLAVSSGGRFAYLGGFAMAGGVIADTRRFGDMVIVADTVAPVVRPKWKNGTDMRQAKSLEFNLFDNFSGIKDYECHIDGEWRTLDYSSLHGRLSHRFDVPLRESDKMHEIVIRAEDCCGNIREWKGRFYR